MLREWCSAQRVLSEYQYWTICIFRQILYEIVWRPTFVSQTTKERRLELANLCTRRTKITKVIKLCESLLNLPNQLKK